MNTIAAVLETVLLVLLLAGFVAALVAATVATVRHDGYGHRPTPRSHERERTWHPPYAA
jgi:hypothetical protein